MTVPIYALKKAGRQLNFRNFTYRPEIWWNYHRTCQTSHGRECLHIGHTPCSMGSFGESGIGQKHLYVWICKRYSSYRSLTLSISQAFSKYINPPQDSLKAWVITDKSSKLIYPAYPQAESQWCPSGNWNDVIQNYSTPVILTRLSGIQIASPGNAPSLVP